MIPIPPSRAKAMASRDSVTVSMAALTMGILIVIRRVSRVRVSVSAGRTEDFPGTSSTSSKVRPTGNADCNIRCPLLLRRRPEMGALRILGGRLFVQQRRRLGLRHFRLLAQLKFAFVGRHELLHAEVRAVQYE